jgi:hypothetical protein
MKCTNCGAFYNTAYGVCLLCGFNTKKQKDLPLIEKTVEIYRQRGWVAVRSSVLGSEIIFLCRDRASMRRVPEPGGVCYLPEELPALRDLTIEQLRLIHTAKKEFGGKVLSLEDIR